MLAPDPAHALLALLQPRFFPWLAGVLVGYAVIMWTNPVRSHFRDGRRALRRYSALWIIPGVFGFCGALFHLAQRAYFAVVLPPEDRPVFMWVRAAWRDKELWLTGSDESVWWLPHAEFLAALKQSWMPAFESLAATFNCLTPTFPVSAVAAILLLLNRGGHQAVLLRALHRRLGVVGWMAHLGIIVCALAAIAKPLLYLAPQMLPATALSVWFQWSPVVVWLSFLFEYLFGVFVQTYLILLAYIWVRGLTFTPSHLLDFAIRRFSSVVKWAGVVLVLSTIFIDAPLILKNFAPFSAWFPADDAFAARLGFARTALAAIALLFATMQITLIFHSESLAAALRDHLAFLREHAWPLAWFLIIAALHCGLLHAGNLAVIRGIGEGTALWVAWSLLFPWLAAVVAAWLLASWVCVYKRCTTPAQVSERPTVLKV